ncbi:helix-turn-helix domain-containing protein [Enterococcus hirae]|uniref:helix-turn-helix domain-containing protein n=1 Tax=Enterococcus hirae TaxID=1354 RepID=UPI001D8B64F7|nr:helix-turn-helix domain-containing protein [Enterococcus hirae]
MIQDYIEKDIVRRVKLVQFLFDLHTLNIVDVSKKLNVTNNTIKADFEKIRVLLSSFIKTDDCTASEITIIFIREISRYELVKKIYTDSKFLNVCARYIQGDSDYLSIVEEEFVSVTKAFSIKKQVEMYFKEVLGEHWLDKARISEIRYRFLIISVCMRCDFLSGKFDNEILKKAEILAQKVLDKFLNKAMERDFLFFKYAVYLAITRQKKNKLIISSYEEEFICSGLIYCQIKEVFDETAESDANACLGNEELIFLCAIYRTISYNPPSYVFLEMDYKYQKDRLLRNFKSIDILMDLIEKEFRLHLRGNILFELPFFNFIYYSIWDLNYFLFERSIFLSESQVDIKRRLVKVLDTWEVYCEGRVPHFTSQNIDNLCSRISSILIPEDTTNPIPLVIVAEDIYSHINYRENLKRWLSPETVSIDDRLYYTMEDIPTYLFTRPHIIICDRSLWIKKECTREGFLFSISSSTILEDIKHIVLTIYETQWWR